MKIVCACIVSALFVAATVAAYSIFENGLSVMVFGVASIAFLYALGIAIVFGLPIRYALKKVGKAKPNSFAIAGGLVGSSFMIVPVIQSHGADTSSLTTLIVLAVAGIFGGLIFGRLSASNNC